jgi:Galactose oxidase, central domain
VPYGPRGSVLLPRDPPRSDVTPAQLSSFGPRLSTLPPSDPRPPRQSMPFLRKKHSDPPSTSAPSGLASSESSQVTQQLQFPTNSQSQSHLQSAQEKQQSQPVYPWSAHAPPFGQSPSPFLRDAHALSTSPTVTGELFLFGGYVDRARKPDNDLYVFSTQDFSTTPLQTKGDVPSPRYAHRAVLTSTTLIIWGGRTISSKQNAQHQSNDDSFYLLNLGTSDLLNVKTRSS